MRQILTHDSLKTVLYFLSSRFWLVDLRLIWLCRPDYQQLIAVDVQERIISSNVQLWLVVGGQRGSLPLQFTLTFFFSFSIFHSRIFTLVFLSHVLPHFRVLHFPFPHFQRLPMVYLFPNFRENPTITFRLILLNRRTNKQRSKQYHRQTWRSKNSLQAS